MQKASPQCCPELPGGLRTHSKKEQDGWSGAGGILFKGKVPVVVLQDILADKLPAKSAETPLGQGVPSEGEMLESSPEEDSVLSHSSLSSSSPTSSPEGQSAPTKRSSPSPLPTSTPIRRVSIFPCISTIGIQRQYSGSSLSLFTQGHCYPDG